MDPHIREVNDLSNYQEFDGLDSFINIDINKLLEGEEYHFSVIYNEIPVDFKFVKGQIQCLAVFFNSALGAVNKNFPIFTGQGISSSLISTRIYFSDPLLMLSKKNKVFWYIGSEKVPVQDIITSILKILMDKLNIKKTIFWGSSGGGFPALLMSHIFKNSIALVNAPTTTIKHHHRAGSIEQIENTLQKANLGEIKSCLDLCEVSQNENKAIILQNNNDKNFIKYHLEPYLKCNGLELKDSSLLNRVNTIKVIYEDWGDGHLVPPKDIIINLLRLLEKSSTDFEESLTPERIQSVVDCSVLVEIKGQYLCTRILNIYEEATYAVYLYKERKLIDRIMYQNNASFVFLKKKYSKGQFFIKVFVRFKNDNFVLIRDSITFYL